ncbi:MAG: FecR domain-containing protein [Bacteroidota bacterium]
MLKKLLEKYRNGNYTAEELQQLQSLLKQKGNQDLESYLDEDWDTFEVKATTHVPSQQMWKRLETSIQGQATTPGLARLPLLKRIGYRITAAAAVALLLFGLGWVYFQQATVPQWQLVHNQSMQPQEIVLSDGTTIWLNTDTKIEYQAPFPNDLRWVKLEGEAFFEVAKNPQRPFIAQTGTLQTRVLGTAFNIQAYPQDTVIQVALKEGKVAIDQLSQQGVVIEVDSLLPGEQMTFNKAQSIFQKNDFAADHPYAWKDHIIYFDGDDIHTVIKKLTEVYKVRFTIEKGATIESLLVYRLNTKRDLLPEVLKDISTITDYRFEKLDKKSYLVKPK